MPANPKNEPTPAFALPVFLARDKQILSDKQHMLKSVSDQAFIQRIFGIGKSLPATAWLAWFYVGGYGDRLSGCSLAAADLPKIYRQVKKSGAPLKDKQVRSLLPPKPPSHLSFISFYYRTKALSLHYYNLEADQINRLRQMTQLLIPREKRGELLFKEIGHSRSGVWELPMSEASPAQIFYKLSAAPLYGWRMFFTDLPSGEPVLHIFGKKQIQRYLFPLWYQRPKILLRAACSWLFFVLTMPILFCTLWGLYHSWYAPSIAAYAQEGNLCGRSLQGSADFFQALLAGGVAGLWCGGYAAYKDWSNPFEVGAASRV